MKIKIGYLPGTIVELILDGIDTLAGAIRAARLNPVGYAVRHNGVPVDIEKEPERKLKEDDQVLLLTEITGN